MFNGLNIITKVISKRKRFLTFMLLPIKVDGLNGGKENFRELINQLTLEFKVSSESFTIDTARLWNKVNPNIKAARTLGSAKNLIKNYCKTLEI